MQCLRRNNENEADGVAAEDECEEVCIDFDPYTFIKNLPPLKHVVPRWRRSLLPRQTRQCKRKTLVRPSCPAYPLSGTQLCVHLNAQQISCSPMLFMACSMLKYGQCDT